MALQAISRNSGATPFCRKPDRRELLSNDTAEAVKATKRRSGTHNQRRRFIESFLAVKIAEKYLAAREAGAVDSTYLDELTEPDTVAAAAPCENRAIPLTEAATPSATGTKMCPPNFLRIINELSPSGPGIGSHKALSKRCRQSANSS